MVDQKPRLPTRSLGSSWWAGRSLPVRSASSLLKNRGLCVCALNSVGPIVSAHLLVFALLLVFASLSCHASR